MKVQISERASRFHTNVFSELAQLKREKEALGQEIIDLSVGSPDLPPPNFVREALERNIMDPEQYGYSLTGTNDFYRAVSSYYFNRFQVSIDSEREVLLLMGSQDGLIQIPLIFTNPGEIILVPDPGYTAYEAGVKLAGANLYPMPLKAENNFLPCLEDIPEDIAREAKMMFLNFPGNPVPALADHAFFQRVVSFAKKYNIIVVHDFAYSELIFDGRKAISFLSVKGAKEIGIEINSLSKSFNLAGARIGYAIGNSNIIKAIQRVKSNLDYGVFLPIQKAAVEALENGADFLYANAKTYEKRRDILVKGLAEIGWEVNLSPATMFLWAKIPKDWSSKDFAFTLLEKTGVVVTPGNAFGQYGEGYVRIALVQNEEWLKKAIDRIKESNLFDQKQRV